MKPALLSLLCFAFVSAPVTSIAQRADDPSGATTINGELRSKTLEVVKQRALAGDADAQLQLALGHLVGGLLPQDDKLAAQWCLRAARQGNEAAETTMGYLYSAGKGVRRSDRKAMSWWRKAADQGSADAEFNLGEFYALGQGVKRDDQEAIKWFRKAADQNEADAQYHLGLMYEGGNGVASDVVEAMHWYRLAAAQGFPDAVKRVDAFDGSFPRKHEFTVGEHPDLGVDQALEQMAQEYSGQVTDRVVRDDIAFPASETEYVALGKHAVLLIAAVTHDPAELPIARVYLERGNGVIQLQRIGSFLCRTKPGSTVERVLGPYRENALFLLPLSAYFQPARLLVDFSRNRSGFQLIQFPGEIRVKFVLADPERAQDSGSAISPEALNAMVLREYGLDLKTQAPPQKH